MQGIFKHANKRLVAAVQRALIEQEEVQEFDDAEDEREWLSLFATVCQEDAFAIKEQFEDSAQVRSFFDEPLELEEILQSVAS